MEEEMRQLARSAARFSGEKHSAVVRKRRRVVRWRESIVRTDG